MVKNLPQLITSIIACQLIGIGSTPFTINAIPTWYAFLEKPFFSPPNWIFGPVWTSLYLMMGIAWYLVWRQGWHKKAVKKAGWFFLTQLVLNFCWSLLFFGLKSPELALAEVVALWLSIVLTMKEFYPLSKPAFYLMVPYLLWVSFASILNAAIVILN